MYLVCACEVLIGGGDHAAVGVFQTVKTRLQTLHRDAAQIDDIATHCFFVGRDKRLHDIAVIQNHIRL